MKMGNEMDWDYNCGEGWSAWSQQNDDGDRFEWRITLNCDGEFCVDESDSELTERKDTFNSLSAAKAFCQASEDAWWDTSSQTASDSTAQQRQDDEARDDWFTREELDRELPK
jgi:hypothetical protein